MEIKSITDDGTMNHSITVDVTCTLTLNNMPLKNAIDSTMSILGTSGISAGELELHVTSVNGISIDDVELTSGEVGAILNDDYTIVEDDECSDIQEEDDEPVESGRVIAVMTHGEESVHD